MKVGIVGSRHFHDLDQVERFVRALIHKYPAAEIGSGGARGVDIEAEQTARDCRPSALWSWRPTKRGRLYVVLLHEVRFVPVFSSRTQIVREPDGAPYKFPSFGTAAFSRNTWIVEWCDRLVAFWDGVSRGTKDSMDKAEALGKPLLVYR